MQRGFQFVRGSALMRWIAVAAVLFSILYFSISVPFSRAATAQFPDEQSLAGFLGLFNGLSTAAAFLASLFLANRLYARFGLMTMLLAFPVLYLVGFGVVALWPAFISVVAFRFAQMLWLSGLADPAYQALFNAVPAERRDQVRAFIGGVPEQAGTFLAGLVLLVGERAFSPEQLYLAGLAAAAVTTFVLWRAGRAYGHALLDALRAGQPGPFFETEAPFGGARLDASAVQTAVAALREPDPNLRRVAAEIIGYLPATGPAATTALVAALHDAIPEVRVAALQALARARLTPALLDVAARLSDPEPEVRLQAVETLRVLAGYPQGLALHLQPRLSDPEAAVQARAAAALLNLGPHPEARDLLRRMAVLGELDERVHALNALATWGDAEAFALIEAELADTYAPSPARRAAARALAACGLPAAAPLAAALADRDQGVRATAAEALARLGPAVLDHAAAALDNPAAEEGALLALEHLPAYQAADRLARYVDRRLTAALHYDILWRDVEPQAQDDHSRLMADTLRDSARRQALNAMRAIGLVSDRAAIFLALAGLQSRDAARRANALEALEATRERDRLRPFLALWEPADPNRRVVPLEQHLVDLLESEPDAWIRASAALAASRSADPQVQAALERRAAADPDPLVSATAQSFRRGPMDTLATLSVMERILFLRRVPLFADLAPVDLQQVAALAAEQVFPDGEVLAEQGEAGEEMFIIVSGEVRVLAHGAEVARRGTGDVVGEMAIISQEPRMASLVAAGAVRVLCLDQASFEGLLRERPDVSLAVMRVLCARLREAAR
jgi:HEAT repeat protein